MGRPALLFGMLALSAAACGGRQMLEPPPDVDGGAAGAAGATAAFSVGPVDLSQAPAEIPASCPGGFGAIAFQNPCLVGHNLFGQATLGVHEVECHLAIAGAPIEWSFLLTLSSVSADQATTTGPFPLSPTGGQLITIGTVSASITAMEGTLTFSRIDPVNRAFVARFHGSIAWTEPSGMKFACTIDAPFWGAPGPFT
jgi:hypothetical protein